MVHITELMLRKRAEHNSGMLSDLEEVSLHQQDLEGINKVLGHLCPRLQILYLQNNLIGRIENLRRLKSLKYLNMAVNNVSYISGLESCEALEKLDLTVNFVDVDTLHTVQRLRVNHALRELYFTGNPCTKWEVYRPCVISMLPQLTRLDGTDITHSERIRADQDAEQLALRLRVAGDKMREEKGLCDIGYNDVEDEDDEDWSEKKSAYSAGVRLADYRGKINREEEQARADQERSEAADPYTQWEKKAKQEREQREAEARARGEELPIRQCNEGGWEFSMDDDGTNVILEVELQRHLDMSLIDIDVQPNHVAVIVKKKKLQLRLPGEVRPGDAKAARAAVSGSLRITMPRVTETVVPSAPRQKQLSPRSKQREAQIKSGRTRLLEKKERPVDIYNMLDSGVSSMRLTDDDIRAVDAAGDSAGEDTSAAPSADFVDDDEVPPLE